MSYWQALENAVKAKRMKEDNILRKEALDAAIAENEASLRAVQQAIARDKESSEKLKAHMDHTRKQRIDQCKMEAHKFKEYMQHVMDEREEHKKKEQQELARRLAHEQKLQDEADKKRAEEIEEERKQQNRLESIQMAKVRYFPEFRVK